MARNSLIAQYKYFLIPVFVVGLGVAIFGSFQFSKRPVTTSVTTMHTRSEVLAPKIVEKTNIQKLWEKKGLTEDLAPLAKPLKRFSESALPVVLKTKSPTYKNAYVSVTLNISEKNYKMGNNDRFAVTTSIKNLTSGHLAYRVVTEKTPSFVECLSPMGRHMSHGFILKPGEEVERFEGCAFSPKISLKIPTVQVMVLPPAAFVTLARITIPLGLSPRLEKSHRPYKIHKLPPCPIYAEKARFNKEIAKNAVAWFDIMDFFARHDCETDSVP